ncbi:hypothetical protein [Streptomyces sp. DSM 40750]|uniref:hypothetical protein n=1 Tax=Streptomyces sp. DSM 40750 TaxID=2801030 RepID=UPI00214B596C|nr:hypothetical protein [Streptomyces sp. DSM 40750]UUU23750.1 hypothetical protein JIX55_27750 [Streptomyces sp. DSM 40750]
MLVLRGMPVLAVMSGILLLTGCEDASGSHAGSGAALSSSPSVNASVRAGTPPHVPARTTTPTPSRTSAAPAGATASPTPTGTATAVGRSGCHNLTATDAVKSAVTAAYRRGFPRFAHMQPVPRQFFYGQCGDVRYAATRFESTPGATYEELVSTQDEGSVTKYFRGTSADSWSYIASDTFPRGPHGCGDVPQIPEALAAAWGNCWVMGPTW